MHAAGALDGGRHKRAEGDGVARAGGGVGQQVGFGQQLEFGGGPDLAGGREVGDTAGEIDHAADGRVVRAVR